MLYSNLSISIQIVINVIRMENPKVNFRFVDAVFKLRKMSMGVVGIT